MFVCHGVFNGEIFVGIFTFCPSLYICNCSRDEIMSETVPRCHWCHNIADTINHFLPRSRVFPINDDLNHDEHFHDYHDVLEPNHEVALLLCSLFMTLMCSLNIVCMWSPKPSNLTKIITNLVYKWGHL